MFNLHKKHIANAKFHVNEKVIFKRSNIDCSMSDNYIYNPHDYREKYLNEVLTISEIHYSRKRGIYYSVKEVYDFIFYENEIEAFNKEENAKLC